MPAKDAGANIEIACRPLRGRQASSNRPGGAYIFHHLVGHYLTRVPLSEFGESYTVYHVDTEAHEIILANGAPAETFVDNVSRSVFDNYAEFEALYGDPKEMKELPYPRAANARHLPERIKNRLSIATATISAKIA